MPGALLLPTGPQEAPTLETGVVATTDHAALNRVAKGTQTVSVWKDARALGKAAGEIAAKLASGTAMSDIEGSVEWTSPAGTTMTAMFLAPVPITKDNLTTVVDAGWISKEDLCQGVSGGPAPCN